MKKLCITTVLFITFLTSCGDTFEARTYEDEGMAILHKRNAFVEFEEGHPSTINLESDEELSITIEVAECNQIVESECTATREGNIISIHSSATNLIQTGGYGLRSTGCTTHEITCDLEPLPEGNYEMEYAGETIDFSIPNTETAMVGSY